jgi:hypothetical protein
MNKRIRITALLVIVLVLGRSFAFFEIDDSNDEVFRQSFNEGYNVYAIPLPNDLNFAGEPVPTDDPEVYERMDRELLVNTYWQSNGLLLIKRAHKYFPIIEPILAEYNIPDDFKYLAIAESGLQDVVSPAGAAGFWQLMPATAKGYGLEVSDQVDERYNLIKSTEAACKYLIEARDRFGNWTLAAASYNMGMAGVNRQLERQKVDNYYDLLLNNETSRYVFRILAMKEIFSNPRKFGFNYRSKDLYYMPELRYVEVDSSVSHWADWAQQFDMTYKDLKTYNPWLRQSYLRNSEGKKYIIAVIDQKTEEKESVEIAEYESIPISSPIITEVYRVSGGIDSTAFYKLNPNLKADSLLPIGTIIHIPLK